MLSPNPLPATAHPSRTPLAASREECSDSRAGCHLLLLGSCLFLGALVVSRMRTVKFPVAIPCQASKQAASSQGTDGSAPLVPHGSSQSKGGALRACGLPITGIGATAKSHCDLWTWSIQPSLWSSGGPHGGSQAWAHVQISSSDTMSPPPLCFQFPTRVSGLAPDIFFLFFCFLNCFLLVSFHKGHMNTCGSSRHKRGPHRAKLEVPCPSRAHAAGQGSHRCSVPTQPHPTQFLFSCMYTCQLFSSEIQNLGTLAWGLGHLPLEDQGSSSSSDSRSNS